MSDLYLEDTIRGADASAVGEKQLIEDVQDLVQGSSPVMTADAAEPTQSVRSSPTRFVSPCTYTGSVRRGLTGPHPAPRVAVGTYATPSL